jgi:hypothetical protein
MTAQQSVHSTVMIVSALALGATATAQQAELYRKPPGVVTRWSSFENPSGEKGRGGVLNRGAKGHPSDSIEAGETKVLLDVNGPGVIRRVWLTIMDRSPQMLRSLKIEMYWDGAPTPAVSAPVGDFFGVGLGRRVPFESALFTDPQGKSFNCLVPMPFRKGARITVVNEGTARLSHIFYDVDYTTSAAAEGDTLYFHAHWRRENPTRLGQDFTILPKIAGSGRFLGVNVGVIASKDYGDCWWGEGEIKIFLDGDGDHPTLIGTGTEDYIGTGWGMDVFSHAYQGCLIADAARLHYAFYRYHVEDPVWFDSDCTVTMQQIGGNQKARVIAMLKAGVPLEPISIDKDGKLIRLLDLQPVPSLEDPSLPEAWTNFYRRDDWSATAYFYLDSPENRLGPIAPVAERIAGLAEDATGTP